jgi:hypothetical protein
MRDRRHGPSQKETIAVSHFHSACVAAILGAALCCGSGAFTSVIAQADTAQACAKADLALMHRLADEHGTSAAPASQLTRAAMKVIEARAACRGGEYARGLVLYSEADALTGGEASPAVTQLR